MAKNTSSGINFFGMLGILFIALKLTHFIDWSWWAVLSPLWIPMSIAIVVVVILAIVQKIVDK
jgi:hypothetical protein